MFVLFLVYFSINGCLRGFKIIRVIVGGMIIVFVVIVRLFYGYIGLVEK